MDKIKERAEQILKNVFGYDTFRPLQLEIIRNVLSKKDTMAIMPTGGGKSMCYQIPALMFPGITIVVSPLISLMQDQVSSLVENGIQAVYLNSSLEWTDYLDSVKELKKGNIKLVYVSPEGLSTGRMQSILHDCSVPVSCITIDEAHCVSEWGHDFRPDYMNIAAVRAQFPEAVCLALTATATVHVRQDIIRNLRLKTPVLFTASFNRENIFLEVKQKKNPLNQIIECLEKHKDESGIIYCFSRKQVDQVYESLGTLGYSVLNYHAGLSDSERAKNQDLFIKDKVRIMVATVAFGMGINKPNVRFVIHHDLPKSLEEYYQEIGRAGRDGLESHALLLYSPGDIHKIRFFFQEAADPEKSEMLLQGMLNYAKSRTCRRSQLLKYFGETFDPSGEKSDVCCDICSSDSIPENDLTIPAQKFMSCMVRLQQRYGAAYIIDVLMGSRQKRILENNHNQLSTWGIGKDLDKEQWFELSELLIERGYILKTGEYNILMLTNYGKNVLVNREKIMLPMNITAGRILNMSKPQKTLFALHKKGAFAKTLSGKDLELYNRIKEWRLKQAEEQNVPPYIIFGDKTLEELVEKHPVTERELLGIFGIGQAKAEKIGSQLLRLISDNS